MTYLADWYIYLIIESMNLEDLTLGELKEAQDKDPNNKEIKEAIHSVLNMEVNIKDRGATSSEWAE